MNWISKVKKIAVCGVASLGILSSTGNIGLSAMYPFQFSGFSTSNCGSSYVGFSTSNCGSNYVGFSSYEAERIRVSMMVPSSQFSGFSTANHGSDFVGFSSQQAERIGASMPAVSGNTMPCNATGCVNLPAISVGGRNVRDLDEREKIELTRRAIALYDKGNTTWDNVAMLLEISPSTLQNWVRLYEGVAVVRYTAQEKRAHVLTYLKERRMFNSTPADYAERHGLIVSTFRNWLSEYEK